MSDLDLALDAFVRSVGVNRGSPHALLLGAGASITSGIPSAEMCIWERKQSIFLTNNPGLEQQFSELSLPSVRQRIQDWLDKRGGFPQRGSPDEYEFYIEECYPIADHRRQYFQERIRPARPHVGYRLLCLMAESDLFRTVWTNTLYFRHRRATIEPMPALAGSHQVKRASVQAGILRAGNPEVHFVLKVSLLRNAFCRSYLFPGRIDTHDRATKRTKF